jgi:S1-C subfamily serine protease
MSGLSHVILRSGSRSACGRVGPAAFPRVVVAFALLLAIGTGGQASAQSADFASKYRAIKPSVVYVFSRWRSQAASGTGFVLRSDERHSEIITANHVISEPAGPATSVTIYFDSDLKHPYPATVLRRDVKRDIALLSVDAPKKVPLPLANITDVQEGMQIAVIGYPRSTEEFKDKFGDDLRLVVNSGIVGAIRVNGEIVQIDAPVDHGDSGGPVVDVRTGHVVGIVHGGLLDPSYQKLGLENRLPGSEYIMSTLAIQNMLLSNASAADADSAPVPVKRDAKAAAYHIALVKETAPDVRQLPANLQQKTPQDLQANYDAMFEHLKGALEEANMAYFVTLVSDKIDTKNVPAICEKLNVNAVLATAMHSNVTDTKDSFFGEQIDAHTYVQLALLDCSGYVLYYANETGNKSRSVDVVTLANKTTDQVLKAFAAYRAARSGLWSSLLKTGVPIDPADDTYWSLYSVYPKKDDAFRVQFVRPGGPAAVAGLRENDVIEAYEDKPCKDIKDVTEFLSLVGSKASYKLTVRRPEGPAAVTIEAKKYAGIVTMMNGDDAKP